ncbi:SDR family oxidoreductase [Frondihabitans australicus]|uniref:NADP-dependent 3-hydroxy acid dehydrogenase YdfG n=1 Tax=Frondihabitans australicus TaxID=386892 RepID=A0A495ILJ4_9MICO|nr:SDR family NAD(P)-dependent oxidoreductase [Frondihabitans australicus]RKR76600.1 NADP-dependent 3-hydroxy acid dehydrogenase YdfG [Frondihabitans australicus]
MSEVRAVGGPAAEGGAGAPGDERVVWVTGAGSGMGRASALAAARAGWRVALMGRREGRLEGVAGEIEAAGGAALVVPGDTAVTGDVEVARDRILRTWGRIDAVVAAAGLNAKRRAFADQTMAGFDEVVATNLGGTMRAIDAALPSLRERGGTVVVISSYSAWSFVPYSGVAYSASKTALGAMTRMLNAQEAGHGIRATHLCPGDVATEFLELRPSVPDEAARAVMLTPDDIGRTVQFVLDSPPHVRIDELVVSPLSQV